MNLRILPSLLPLLYLTAGTVTTNVQLLWHPIVDPASITFSKGGTGGDFLFSTAPFNLDKVGANGTVTITLTNKLDTRITNFEFTVNKLQATPIEGANHGKQC